MNEYLSNEGAVYRLGYHIIWCPKYRRKVLINGVEKRLKELILEKALINKWDIKALEIMPDHVHLFVMTGPNDSPSHIANQFKGYSSRVLREEFNWLKRRLPTLWSRSYFATTVGNVSERAIQKYIEEQKYS